MGEAPCGCDLLEAAATTADPRDRERKRREGAQFQRLWQCPRAGHCGTATHDAPRAALAQVEALTGAEGLATCPGYYARLHWVGDVVRLRRWWKTGQLGLKLPHPPAVVTDAIDALEDGLALREAAEVAAVREASRHQAPPPPPGGGARRPPGPPKPKQ